MLKIIFHIVTEIMDTTMNISNREEVREAVLEDKTQ